MTRVVNPAGSLMQEELVCCSYMSSKSTSLLSEANPTISRTIFFRSAMEMPTEHPAPEAPAMLTIHVSLASGRSVTLSAAANSKVRELIAAAEKALEVDESWYSLELIADGRLLHLTETLADAKLCDDDTVTAVVKIIEERFAVVKREERAASVVVLEFL